MNQVKHYIATLNARVDGIPCLVGVESFYIEPGSHSFHAASDWDYHGYAEMEYDILDRRGRPAPWLEKKLDKFSRQEIECLIKDNYRSGDDDY